MKETPKKKKRWKESEITFRFLLAKNQCRQEVYIARIPKWWPTPDRSREGSPTRLFRITSQNVQENNVGRGEIMTMMTEGGTGSFLIDFSNDDM